MKTTILPLNSITRSRVRAFVLLPFLLACFAPEARATCQDACLTNSNTVLGDDALLNNTSGSLNTAMGFNALYSNTTGTYNAAIGADALLTNTTGISNSAFGFNALLNNETGDDNTAVGAGALASNRAGGYNVAVGQNALGTDNGGGNVAIGFEALSFTIGSGNIALGYVAGDGIKHGNNNVMIGNVGMTSDSGKIRIGTRGTHVAAFIAGISGATVPTGVPVIVDTSGHLGTSTSSARFKEEIKPMDKVSEAILALKPVTFRYKHELDPAGIPQFGLVAEEVVKVNPDLVARDEQGKAYTVRYEAVNAMLLNEFLKARRQIDAQQKQIDALTAGLQNVSAQLQMTKPALQTIANNQ